MLRYLLAAWYYFSAWYYYPLGGVNRVAYKLGPFLEHVFRVSTGAKHVVDLRATYTIR